MKFLRFCAQFSVPIATAGITTCIVSLPSQAVELVFSSPGVIKGINGVSFTLPSTGISRTYNVILERGTVNDIYGTPPLFDVFTEEDALAAMNASAQGINFYITNVSENLSFESLGTDVFYIPYFTDSVKVVASSSARQHIVAQRLIAVGIIDLPVDVEVVYTRLIQVPEPTSTLGLLSLGIIGAGATIKRQVKRNHSIEKETTEIG
ncbi:MULTISPECIES: PEP-CTERM sorting domain-containing protein [Microcystis]|uniref:PEP-CTERM sorting domain-containing protein n=1 Tax=Microcystis TaxID=1125 RepID=UPI001F5578CE|nr:MULTISPECIES: PEP-CTERM sorting domain-containing protein [Microcystis]UZO77969.1 PEP-CTERM sorting domain-containing protein [Microcystis aeruginosa str. Chao 1910]